MTDQDTINHLRREFRENNIRTLCLINRHTVRSGMSRYIEALSILPDSTYEDGLRVRTYAYNIAKILGRKYVQWKGYDCVVMRGCGLDLGQALVEALSKAMYEETTIDDLPPCVAFGTPPEKVLIARWL